MFDRVSRWNLSPRMGPIVWQREKKLRISTASADRPRKGSSKIYRVSRDILPEPSAEKVHVFQFWICEGTSQAIWPFLQWYRIVDVLVETLYHSFSKKYVLQQRLVNRNLRYRDIIMFLSLLGYNGYTLARICHCLMDGTLFRRWNKEK